MQSYTFRQCTLTLLDKLFGLRQIFADPILDQWLQGEPTLSDYEQKTLQELRTLLNLNVPSWNEQELAQHFIGPLLNLVRFTEPYRFNLFATRKIGATLTANDGDIELSGEPDGIIATGFREPEIPMFAFTEYKRQLDPEGDPAGQTLAAMLVAQRLNPKPHPIYGCYVIGRDWFFMVLHEKHYAVSTGHNALQHPELEDILRILKTLKLIILDLTAT
ncbi:MAG: hypothetical protein DYG89_26715 [Caldilinea sp. CFX5]|nr:hypothetical protein [Caldilinea sp. CFX5]